ncbi:3-hydroxyacyl-CoA dehydrogenase NAD-binding domain-containing protein [Nisaea nitritireducens]|uniref:3-hydroxyacyl-CoA dehydrogenase NAD-binding domain-containing protein n=1 Tax=Nisaea nitritireducens TaxID=568392 RepID=UPI001865EFDD|nr:3-hydroxyacyl-CoA dehydrogenase NAD-binding domain-containing protein [Nisaea nitritireducens]
MAQYPAVDAVRKIGILGGGTIGASWSAFFLSKGYDVVAWDPGPDAEAKMRAFIDNAWPQLTELGLSAGAAVARLRFVATPEEAVVGCDFIQESAPERLDIKQELYARVDAVIEPRTIFASSTSGLVMSDLQQGLKNASQFVVGHPFNPPHLIPLVEVVAGKDSDPAAADWAMDFYRHVGKHPIRLKKELKGHLANRLQAALWREAVMAVKEDVASIEDIDAAMSQGPGLRLALMGPHMIFGLAGGKGGMGHFYDHIGPAMEAWWETMQETPKLDADLRAKLIEGVDAEAAGRSIDQLEAERDDKLIALLKMLQAKG